jgi:Holliday junction resolvasome RuvABC endonuclease subunit
MVTRLLRLKSAPQPSDASDGVAAALALVMRARYNHRVGAAIAATASGRSAAIHAPPGRERA